MKIIFLDIDGTLIDYDLNLPESAISAIQRSREKGNIIVLTTGRSKSEIDESIIDIGFDGIIGGNGVYIEYQGEILYDEAIPLSLEKQLVDYLNEQAIGFYLESKSGLFANRYLHTVLEKVFDPMKIEKYFKHFTITDDLYRDDIAKISFYLEPRSILDDMKKVFDGQCVFHSWSSSGKGHDFGEVATSGVDKAIAIQKLIAHLKIDHQHTMAFGDASNDLGMIDYVHHGVAMGNAIIELKEIANDVTEEVWNDGLYKAFEKYNLI